MAFTFDGSTEAIYWDTVPVSAAAWTVSFWMRTPGGVAQNPWWLGNVADGDRWGIITDAGDTVRLYAKVSSTANATTTNTLTADTWVNVVGIETSATDRRCVLGGDWASSGTNATSKAPASVDRMSIGARYDTSPDTFFDGEIAELAVWDAALVQADVEMLAAGLDPRKVKPVDLVFYAPLERGLQDIVGGLTASTT